jgi:hypothetical protein
MIKGTSRKSKLGFEPENLRLVNDEDNGERPKTVLVKAFQCPSCQKVTPPVESSEIENLYRVIDEDEDEEELLTALRNVYRGKKGRLVWGAKSITLPELEARVCDTCLYFSRLRDM